MGLSRKFVCSGCSQPIDCPPGEKNLYQTDEHPGPYHKNCLDTLLKWEPIIKAEERDRWAAEKELNER